MLQVIGSCRGQISEHIFAPNEGYSLFMCGYQCDTAVNKNDTREVI